MGERVVLTWAEFDKIIYKWEHDNNNSRITRLYFDGAEAIPHYVGKNSECDVSYGKPGFMLSTGERIDI